MAATAKTSSQPSSWHIKARALLQAGRYQEAEALLTRVRKADSTNPALLHLLGLAARDGGNLQRAVSLLEQAVQHAPRISAYQADLAYVNLIGGRYDEAASFYHKTLALDPAAHKARLGLGMAYIGRREFHAAVSQISQYLEVQPLAAEGHLQLGIALSELGQHEPAIASIGAALKLKPNVADGNLRLGEAQARAGRPEQALAFLRRALELDFGSTAARARIRQLEQQPSGTPARSLPLTREMMPALYAMAERATIMGKFDEAGWCYEKALELHSDVPAPYQGLAQIRFIEGKPVEARQYALEAAARGADPAGVQTMLGQIYESEGNFPAAIEAFAKAVAIRPSETQAQLKLAMLRQSDDAVAQIATLEELRRSASLTPPEQAALEFALARNHDRLKDHDSAFAHYIAGNNLRKSLTQPYRPDPSVVDGLIAAFTPDLLARRSALGHPSHRPVFVLGMMRSGTTLMEQILASHPAVFGHSELSDLLRIALALPAVTGGDQPYPQCVELMDKPRVQHLAGAYLAKLEREAPNVLRSVDKMPQNFQHIGLIALLFPNARIIHCTRDPVDTCLSNYFHDYGSPNAYTYDLEWLGTYYREYQRLMDHWIATLPDMILSVAYEDMVADQENWSRRAIEFIGLPWDDACLSFHSNERTVNTFSVWQVRQPIYRTSVRRWEKYRRHLGPLLSALGMRDL